MKKIKLSLTSILFLLISFSAKANCDSCNVTANFSAYTTASCQIIMQDISTTDSCSYHIYSIMNYGNGIVDTIPAGDSIPDRFSQGTYNACLTAYAIRYDSLGNDTCQDTYCQSITKSICNNPGFFRKKSPTESVKELAVYPNPTTDNVTLDLPNETSDIKIYSINGQLIFSKSIIDIEKIRLSVSSWKKGIYYIETISNGISSTRKLIVN